MTQIRVELELADGSFQTKILRAGKGIQDLRNEITRTNPALARMAASGAEIVRSYTQVNNATKGFLGTLRDVSIVAGLASLGISKLAGVSNSWIGDVVRINAEMERLNVQMQAMSSAADPVKQAGDTVAYLRAQAQQMPFSLTAITNGFVKLKATGIDPTQKAFKSIADGVAAFGGTDESFSRVVLAITQMSGKGVIQMEELRQQLGEAMPNAVALMARSMGVSMAQLLKDINTGTVQAKPALEQLYAELDRTYGGRAQAMMQTFDGQLKTTVTQLNNFALAIGGQTAEGTWAEGSFFATVKEQLSDINDMLGTDAAKQFATSIGSGLTQVVVGLRETINTLFVFRRELLAVGQIAAGVFAFRIASAGLASLQLSLRETTVQLSNAGLKFQQAQSWFAFTSGGFTSMATAGLAAQGALRGVAAGLAGVAAGFSAIMPWVAAIGIAVYAASSYFDIFGTRVREAYDDLVKFGAESKRQAEEIVATRRKQIESEMAVMDRRRRQRGTMGQNDYAEQRFRELQLELEALVEESGGLIEDAERREIEKAQRLYERKIQDQIATRKRGYNEEANALSEKYEAEQSAAVKAGESIKAIDEKYQSDLLELRKKLAREELAIYREQIRQEEGGLANATDSQRKIIQSHLDWLKDQARAAREQLTAIEQSGLAGFGVATIAKPTDDKAAFERGQKALDALKTDVAALTARLGEASGAAAAMMQRIQAGDYGNIKDGTEAVREQAAALMELATLKEALDKAAQGQRKIEQDIENARQKAIEEEYELRAKATGRELTDAEKIRLKLDNGYYAGLGSLENIRKAFEGVISTFKVQGEASNQLGTVLRENTFGAQTVQRINTVTEAMQKMAETIGTIGSGLNGLDFNQISMDEGLDRRGEARFGVTTAGANFRNNISLVSQDLADFHAQIAGKANLMSRSEGRFGNPADDQWRTNNIADISTPSGLKVAVNKLSAGYFEGFLRELEESGYKISSIGGFSYRNKIGRSALSEHAYGNAIDINPAKNPYSQTLETDMPANISLLAAKYGLSWGGDWKSVKDPMHFEWTGMNPPGLARKAAQWPPNGYGAGAAPTAPAAAGPLPTFDSVGIQEQVNGLVADRVALTKTLEDELAEIDKHEKSNQDLKKDVARNETLKELKEAAADASLDVEKLGKNYARVTKAIREGKLGKSTDIGAPEYKDVLKAAQDLDATEKRIAETKSAQRASDTQLKDLEAQRLDLVRQAEDAHRKMLDPLHREASSAYRALEKDLDQYLANVKRVYTEDSAEFRNAQQFKAQMLRQQKQTELTQEMATGEEERRQLRLSLMSETQQRQENLKRELEMIDRRVQAAREAGMDMVEIERLAEAQKETIRAKYAAEQNPMAAQFKEWGDLQGNLAKQSAQWMDSLAGGITDLITGTGDLRSLLNGMLKDIVGMGVKYALSGFGSKGGGGKGAKGAKAGSAATKGKSFPTMHGGGVIGAGGRLTTSLTPLAFLGAERFHIGGQVGLKPGEVPIVAKEGEVIGWPDQLAAAFGGKGGADGMQVSINSPITVHGSAGTPEQNQDLAERTRREVNAGLRGLVVDEIARQMRPGGMFTQKSY